MYIKVIALKEKKDTLQSPTSQILVFNKQTPP